MTYSLDLRHVQAPLKERYSADASSALVVSEARSVLSDLNDPRHCAVAPGEFPDVVIRAGLHPAAGGAGDTPCSRHPRRRERYSSTLQTLRSGVEVKTDFQLE